VKEGKGRSEEEEKDNGMGAGRVRNIIRIRKKRDGFNDAC
jgi:hypothetical protein